MNPEYCTIGRIVKPHGNKGEVKVVLMSDFPDRFEKRRSVFLEPPPEPTRMIIQSARPHKNGFLVKFEGIDTISDAEALVQRFVRIPEEELEPLEEGSFYWHQLQGLRVIDEGDHTMGVVERIFRAGDLGNEVLVVGCEKGERFVPMIDDVVLCVDLDAGTIRVRLPEGI
ncbi:MAG: 16S rRNA processing protein RimM [Candidatus Coatesbacteria bacterium]|nr:16S rRNA processing protein RimM [Candidatus Coatesbacteria bacterium]